MNRFYAEQAPELEITNVLDDGLLRLLADGRAADVTVRVRDMLTSVERTYRPALALITCSSISRAMVRELQPHTAMPLLKIDDAMARRAVEAGARIGVVATFAPTIDPTSALLSESATGVQLITKVAPEAYTALFAGDGATHDRIVADAAERLANAGADAIVLAQVSMARAYDECAARVRVPVFTSLHTSLAALRQALAQRATAARS